MRFWVLAAALALMAPFSSATLVSCTVTSGTVLTATSGGLAYSIANGIGTATGGATGTISCPTITTGVGVIQNYQVLATVDYQGGPFGTTSGTEVTQTLTLIGGALNGTSVSPVISGGNSSSSVSLGSPFQIGATLGGLAMYGAFTVNVTSSVTFGGPVGGSSGQVVLSYDVGPAIPEPGTLGMLSAGLIGLGYLGRRRRK